MDLKEKLIVSWKRIKEDRKTDFILSDFEYRIFDKYHNELLDSLAQKIELLLSGAVPDSYRPEQLRTIRVPKASFTTRPGSIPTIEDRIYYQFLVDELAEEIEQNLVPLDDKVVHSYRYSCERKSEKMFKYESASYKTFNVKTEEIASGYNFIIITDVSSYFERIYHHDLENTLLGLGANVKYVQLLMNLLRKWNKGNSYSIPQGLWPSDYLGNVYLDPVDKFMIRNGYDSYCRYMDDIRLGANSILEAQSVLLLLEEKLNRFGLALNAGKTRIISNYDVDELLFPFKRRFEEISDEIWFDASISSFGPYSGSEDDDQLDHEIRLQSFRQLFREQLSMEQPDPYICRYCLKQFRISKDEEILSDIIQNIEKLFVVTPQIVNYFIALLDDNFIKEYIIDDVINKITTHAICYDWQLMWFIHFLDRTNELKIDHVTKLRNFLTTANVHEAVLINGLLLLGKHGDSETRTWILECYEGTHSQWLKRAILFSLKDLIISKRNHFYSYCRGEHSLNDKIIDYVTSGHS
jgi:retron-type reverse transcriptase